MCNGIINVPVQVYYSTAAVMILGDFQYLWPAVLSVTVLSG